MVLPSCSSPDYWDLSLAGIRLRIVSDCSMPLSEAFHPFLASHQGVDLLATFRQVDTLPFYSDRVVYEDISYRIHPDGDGGYIRAFFDPVRDRSPYAVAAYDYGHGKIQIDYLPHGQSYISQLRDSFFLLGFEALLIHRQRLCLHASCIDTPIGGILFSGVSGIGKSTQASLWCKYRSAKQINGDRPILSKEQNGWLAWGSPYSGSSHIHINARCPVAAIVMLKQAQTCSLRRLTLPEAFRAVWSGLTLHSWNEKLVELASHLTMDLIGTVPVFEFSCTPDEAAVDYLEQELRKECGL